MCVCTNLINLYVYNYTYSQPAPDIYKTTFYLTINVRVVLLYMNTLMCIYISSDLKWIWNLLVYFQNRKWTPGNYDRQKIRLKYWGKLNYQNEKYKSLIERWKWSLYTCTYGTLFSTVQQNLKVR